MPTISKLCVLACSVGAVAAYPKADMLTADYSFAQYKEDFGKAYKDPKEDAARRAIFEQNLKMILRHNAAGGSYKMGLTRFTDAKESEIPRGSKKTKSLALLQKLKRQPHVGTHVMSGKALPKHVDWREHRP